MTSIRDRSDRLFDGIPSAPIIERPPDGLRDEGASPAPPHAAVQLGN
jgi:hypothetical protein